MSGTSVSILRQRCAVAVLVLLSAAAPAAGGDLSDRLLDDARDGRLDDFTFVSAALIAGGIDDECELEGWLNRYANCREGLIQSLPSSEPRSSMPHRWRG